MKINLINKEIQEMLRTSRSTNMTYREHLSKLFSNYKQLLQDNKIELEKYCYIVYPYSELFKTVENSCKILLQIYDSYIRGKIGYAVSLMKKHFTYEESIFNLDLQRDTTLYRARVVNDCGNTIGINSMFHVPFENRNIITNNRFNISGYPCLYLGNSILACWEEMRKPNPDYMFISRYSLNEKVTKKVIDIRWNEHVESSLEVDDDERKGWIQFNIIRFLNTIPLKIACSIPVHDLEASFKEEYVIPQILLLSCIGNKYVDGIAYTSTRRDEQISSDISLHHNYVFPVQKVDDRGYCTTLASNFLMTRGVSFMEADIKNVFHAKGTPNVYVEDSTIVLGTLDQDKSEYECTKFGQMEDYLKTQPRYSLKKIDGKWEEIPREL